MPAPPSAPDPFDAYSDLTRIVVADHSMESVMTTICDVTQRLLPAADEASVTFIENDVPSTVAFTGDLAVLLDERQYEHGVGPCLMAAATATLQRVDDAQTETRWPPFAAAARQHGLGSSLSVPIPLAQKLAAALNIYSREVRGFTADDEQLATTLAGKAGVALANMHLYADKAQLAENLRLAMASRAVIEQAKGVLIERKGVSADAAFQELVSTSQRSNRKLRVVAQDLVDAAVARSASADPAT